MLIALAIIVVVTVVVGLVLVSYITSFINAYKTNVLHVHEAYYYYFPSKPTVIYNRCVKPPCGFVILHLVSEGLEKLALIEYLNYTWNPETQCKWDTSQPGYLDPGDNIIVLTDPRLAYDDIIPACRVVSRRANPRAYTWLFNILMSRGDIDSLSSTEQRLVILYSDLTVDAIFSPTSLRIITATAGSYVIPVIPQRIG